jgi:carbonic anhydrase
MKTYSIAVALFVMLVALHLSSPSELVAAEKENPMLAHMVYFSLNDNSAEARDKLVAACRRHLSGHEGTVFFAAGTLAGEFDRPVNDRDFDVALHVVFKDKAAHDQYQIAPRHLQFIEENKANWKKVRVFDSYVAQ